MRSYYYDQNISNQIEPNFFALVKNQLYFFSDECFVKPCSSKATSVIRLASQKSPKPSSSSSSENVRPSNRQSVKKLVVKLKKPFVPVIEEEANLHPPGK